MLMDQSTDTVCLCSPAEITVSMNSQVFEGVNFLIQFNSILHQDPPASPLSCINLQLVSIAAADTLLHCTAVGF